MTSCNKVIDVNRIHRNAKHDISVSLNALQIITNVRSNLLFPASFEQFSFVSSSLALLLLSFCRDWRPSRFQRRTAMFLFPIWMQHTHVFTYKLQRQIVSTGHGKFFSSSCHKKANAFTTIRITSRLYCTKVLFCLIQSHTQAASAMPNIPLTFLAFNKREEKKPHIRMYTICSHFGLVEFGIELLKKWNQACSWNGQTNIWLHDCLAKHSRWTHTATTTTANPNKLFIYA